jgi:hypothetical protein
VASYFMGRPAALMRASWRPADSRLPTHMINLTTPWKAQNASSNPLTIPAGFVFLHQIV